MLTRTVANFFEENRTLGSYFALRCDHAEADLGMFAEFLQKAPPKAKPEVV